MSRDRRWRRSPRVGDPDPAADVREEVGFHLETQIRDLIAEGLSPEAARVEALRRFGDVARVERSLLDMDRRSAREARRERVLADLGQDVRFAIRQLRKRPFFASVTVLILALGIGANGAVFGVVDGALFRPLPFGDEDRILVLRDVQGEDRDVNVSHPEFADWGREASFLGFITAVASNMLTLRQDAGPEQVQAGLVAGDFVGVLGRAPRVGRGFSAEEIDGALPVAMISEGFWRERFAAAPDVVGRTLILNDEPYTVIGVMPASANLLVERPNVRVWLPLERQEWMARGLHFLQVIARLAEGVSRPEAEQRFDALARSLREQEVTEHGIATQAIRERLVGDARPLLLVLMGSVLFVLVIVCANLANLFLSHSLARGREFAIRAAIGAGRVRVARQLVTEAVVLGLFGAIVGIVFSRALTGVVAAASADAAALAPRGVDLRVVAFTLLASLVAATVSGLWPALRMSRSESASSLREGGRSAGTRKGWRRRRLLVALEVALSITLLAGAGLLVRSLLRLLAVDPGFRAENVMTFEVNLPGTRYQDEARRVQFHEALLERIRALPDVVAVGAVNHVPLRGSDTSGGFLIVGREFPPDEEPQSRKRVATTGYFETLGIPVIAGRSFRAADRAGAPEVVIISQDVARRYWPGEDPIGKRMNFSWGPGEEQEIVGVVGDVHHDALHQPAAGMIYRPIGQFPLHGLGYVVRTRGEPSALAEAIRNEVVALDPAQPIFDVSTLESVVSQSVASRRTLMVLLTGFAALALLLAALGVYAVTVQSVAQRTREIGVRMAVGARRADVLGMVLREELIVVALGILAGLAGAFAATRLLRASLYDVSATDPATFAAAVLVLALVASAAVLLPARRAARIDPVWALRAD